MATDSDIGEDNDSGSIVDGIAANGSRPDSTAVTCTNEDPADATVSNAVAGHVLDTNATDTYDDTDSTPHPIALCRSLSGAHIIPYFYPVSFHIYLHN